ncbi:hypothetical protein CRUP_028891 [Coryphaenoides rupestris]|nr:hypothetical protein CRUP_028891 [Coryphaenoides rupestris]
MSTGMRLCVPPPPALALRGAEYAMRGGLYCCSLGGQEVHSNAPPISSRAAVPQPMYSEAPSSRRWALVSSGL